jgi:ParB-like chromosome segregation protein Spo0J
MKYDHKTKWGVLVEGNHRLAAALKAGVTHLPVAVTTGADLSDRKRKLVGAPLHIDNRIVEKGGWMPSDVHPGNFKQFEGSR